MDLKRLFDDDDAVSPVIGVILMVAITVILAAVIATFVLGLGDQVSNTAPQASFSFNYDGANNNLTVTHTGGDSVQANELYIRGSNDDGSWNNIPGSSYGRTSDITAGNSVTVDVSASATVRVVYVAEEGGNSATLGEWTGPGA
ncbi:MAG: type IV pilin [Haloarculaceae archaeon]